MENINLIRKITWKFYHSTGFDWDELFAEACWLYCKSLQTYDSSRGALSTHVYQFISSELINFLKKEKGYKEPTISIENWNEDSDIAFDNFFESLSKDAQMIAEVILDNPELFDCLSPKEAKNQVVIMLKKEGMRMRDIWIGIKDLKLAFE